MRFGPAGVDGGTFGGGPGGESWSDLRGRGGGGGGGGVVNVL